MFIIVRENHMERYFDEAIETASREEIRKIQSKGLTEAVKR